MDSAWGYQLLVDCYGCSEEACCDIDRSYEFLDDLCQHLGMQKQSQPYIFKTCKIQFPGRPGYSGWLPIIESGIQIHTSAPNKFISIDIYSCKPFPQEAVISFVETFFSPESIESQFIYRGKRIKS